MGKYIQSGMTDETQKNNSASRDNFTILKNGLQYFVLCFLLTTVSCGLFHYINLFCPRWIWLKQVTLFVDILEAPLSLVAGGDQQIVFYLGGTAAIMLVIISIVSWVILIEWLYLKINAFLHNKFDRSKQL